jgi:hypothetical protein
VAIDAQVAAALVRKDMSGAKAVIWVRSSNTMARFIAGVKVVECCESSLRRASRALGEGLDRSRKRYIHSLERCDARRGAGP